VLPGQRESRSAWRTGSGTFRRVTGVDNTQRRAATRQRHSAEIRIEECFGEAMFRFASARIRVELARRKQRRIVCSPKANTAGNVVEVA
jgi:hypothetical protein